MWLNKNTNEVILSAKDVRVNDIQYPSNIFWLWTESELNSIGIYKYVVSEYPNRRYYTATEVIDNVATPPTITYTTVPVDLESLKLNMINQINEKAKELMTTATAKYSPAEMAGWETLEREALQFITDGTIGSMLSGEATMSNQDITTLANEIIANANGFRAYRNFIVSTRYKKTQEVRGIMTIDQAIPNRRNYPRRLDVMTYNQSGITYNEAGVTYNGGTTSVSVTVLVTGSAINLSGGTATASGAANVAVAGSVLNLSGGDVSRSGSATALVTGSSISLSGGNVSAIGAANVSVTGSSIVLSGGSPSVSGAATIQATGSAITLSGGDVIIPQGDLVLVTGSAITLSGGSVTAGTISRRLCFTKILHAPLITVKSTKANNFVKSGHALLTFNKLLGGMLMIQGETYYAKFQTVPSVSLSGYTGAYKLKDKNHLTVAEGSMTLGADYFTLQFGTSTIPIGIYTLYCLVTFPDTFIQCINEEMLEIE